jgi:hypothetical protein
MLSTQRTNVLDLPLVAEAGLILLSFKTDPDRFGCGFGLAFDQSWVNVRYGSMGRYSAMFQAQPYLNGCFLEHDSATESFTLAPTH